ncbi:MAG: thymidine kinase [Micropruina sp.]
MAELIYFAGPMNCGKSTLALQVDYTESTAGRFGRRFTSHDRAGEATISSRIGLVESAIEVAEPFDFWTYVAELTGGRRIDYLVCDEAQFYASEHIDQLARLVDELQIDVYCFGILTDFRTELFPASKRLVELSDRIETLQVRPRCWCGERATHNARTLNGVMVVTGTQVVVGDTQESAAAVAYQTLCRRHHRRKMTAQIAEVTLNPEPLPFGE